MERRPLRKRMALAAVTAAVSAVLGFTGTAQAAPADPEPGVIVVEEIVPVDAYAAPVQAAGTDCTWPVCGEAHNRTGKSLQIHRDSSSRWSCQPSGDKRKTLKSGSGSTKYWEDTDCVRSTKCTIYFRGWKYSPGEWIRLYNPTWFYNVNC